MTARWAASPLDLCVHLLSPEEAHPGDLRKARCGHLMPAVTQHDQPPPGTPYERCSAMFLADVTAARNAVIRRTVDTMPPLSAEQIERLRGLLPAPTVVTDPPDPGRPLVETPGRHPHRQRRHPMRPSLIELVYGTGLPQMVRGPLRWRWALSRPDGPMWSSSAATRER
ncbi:MAG: hypothetical protein ACRDTH_04230 [Pseudonocardiaceae bacterium]